MGAVFRRSKKKKVVPPTKPSYTKQNFSSFNDDSKQNDSKNSHSKRAKKIEPYSKIIPIRETINDILLTNEIKEKEETPKKNENLEENFSNISSIQETNHHLQNNTQPQFTKEKSIEKIDNDFVEGNNEQEEKNPKFFQVFSKDSEWANINIANKLKQFNWPMKGFVEIKTLCFEIEYDYLVKGFKILRNNENMNSSILSWVKIEAEQYFSFDLKDINSFNLKTGQAQQNKKMNEGLKFGVDLKGSYVSF